MNVPPDMPKLTTQELTAQRGTVHGDFTDVSAEAQQMKNIARTSKNWPNLTDAQREGIEMIVHKLARILVGDPNHHDHWNDIAGYAHIVSIRIPEKE